MPTSPQERSSLKEQRERIDEAQCIQRHQEERMTANRRLLRPVPSLSVLSMLATFCAESVVAIHPATYRCPRFLCPFLASSHSYLVHASESFPSSSQFFGPQSIHKRKFDLLRRSTPNGKVPQKLPTKYLKGQDGRYHPESSWSLNGQTLTCAWVAPSPSAVDEMDNVDTSLSPADVGLPENSALTSPSPFPNSQPPEDLPAGWASQEPRSGFYRVPVIIVFALTLTLFITVLIASCALLRRKRRLRRLSLLQKEVSSELEQGPNSVDDSSWAKRIRRQKRNWARSSARWKSNAHLTMRRRRVRGSMSIPVVVSASHHSPAASTENLEISDIPNMQENPSTRQASLPPAYPIRNTEDSTTETSTQIVDDLSEGPKPSTSSGFAHTRSQESLAPHATGTATRYGAHLATDDKAVLEQMAKNASAPESQDTIETSPQAPDWIETDENESTDLSSPHHFHFPLPGSHVNPAIVSVYDGADDCKLTSLTPSSPHSDHSEDLPAFSIPSAPPMEDE